MSTLLKRVGIVTGASSGIGYAVANVLAEAGAIVYAISRTGKVKDETMPVHENVRHVQGDVCDDQTMQAVVDNIVKEHGKLDFLINNAGITEKHRAEAFPIEAFERIMKVNVQSVFRLCQICYPYLKNSEHVGRIVTISSMAAHLGFSEVTPYCVSKAAVLGLTRGLCVEWANNNITVNSVAPGWFPSEMSKQVMDEARKAKILARMPVHCFGDTRDLGAMVRFLLEDSAQYITGQDFAVDGGALAYGF
ncbi:short-chain dehydrogenase [Sporanaerobium hydrogeniformans]|uniref:Short-chain dehydrogenase n=1 Tax=Sporanaerobium hydrogeniformans TaxID=3072179 RepID=A0AC61DB48_9FIRM|nr:SDR family oxidoreductase [Sporanaerobium hydrogeniformans]PHV70100.1 short-chain dehydrogenase [Sporanaerobium hydrogeniformans]